MEQTAKSPSRRGPLRVIIGFGLVIGTSMAALTLLTVVVAIIADRVFDGPATLSPPEAHTHAEEAAKEIRDAPCHHPDGNDRNHDAPRRPDRHGDGSSQRPPPATAGISSTRTRNAAPTRDPGGSQRSCRNTPARNRRDGPKRTATANWPGRSRQHRARRTPGSACRCRRPCSRTPTSWTPHWRQASAWSRES